ncbi:MAG: ABC transporter ATP-binding protein/permease [Bacteroidia bacterium]|nr:ABC transporter ATP-binding protein/permease [Bacteroidia bacterium]
MANFPGLLATSICLLLLNTSLTLIRPLFIAYLLNHYFNTSSDLLVKGVSILICLLVMESILSYFSSLSIARLGQSIIFQIRNKTYSHILKMPSAYFDKTPVGTIITRNVSDIEAMNEIFSQGILQIGGDILMIFLMLVIMLLKDIRLSLSVLLVLPLLFIATAFFRRGVKKSFQMVRDAVAGMNVFVQERLNGMALLRLFNVSSREMERFKTLNARHRDANIKTIFYYSVFFPVMDILTSVSFALLMYFGFNLKHTGQVGLGDLTFFIMMAQMLFRPIRMLADRLNTLQSGLVAAGRVYDLLDKKNMLQDVSQPLPEFPGLKSCITFEHVSFSYTKEKQILNDVSFQLEKGKKLALVGPTGSGKSTIAQLLSGMYLNYEGMIKADGKDVKEWDQASLRKKIFLVLQDVFLFNDTLFENIRFYDPSYTKEAVWKIAEEMGLREFISSFPGGLDYRIQERGSGLSSGQKQLVALMRARLLEPDVFIFDEATSYMDVETENLMQKAMQSILKNKTALVIAHRLSTLMACDDVLVMENGRVIEYSPLREAMQNPNSVFRRYWEEQHKQTDLSKVV